MIKNGLYLPEFDFDSCGVGFVANLKGVKSYKVISDAIIMLENMDSKIYNFIVF
jgi:glutamate synthase (NADPH/NADH) large chain